MANIRPQGCEHCKEPATIHLTQIIGGKLCKVDLCAKCPKAKNIEENTGFSLADELLGLGAGENIKPQEGELVCPVCGFSQPEFKKSGRLGCPACYDTFAEGLSSLLKTMHRGVKHTGKMPARFQRGEQIRARVRELQDQLREAVRSENFEEAARLRDQIRQIESQIAP